MYQEFQTWGGGVQVCPGSRYILDCQELVGGRREHSASAAPFSSLVPTTVREASHSGPSEAPSHPFPLFHPKTLRFRKAE